ncbi:MAG: hypothetical protein ABSH28_07345 [Acidobacteriota bacterium]|jgi:hypothetical protein
MRRKYGETFWTFIVEVMDWELSYSIRLDEGKYGSAWFSDSLHLEIKGVIRLPDKYAEKEIDACFVGSRDMLPDKNRKSYRISNPICVGELRLQGEKRQFLGGIPIESLPTIASMLETKRIKYFDLHGLSPRWGHAKIKSVGFFRDYNPDDY